MAADIFPASDSAFWNLKLSLFFCYIVFDNGKRIYYHNLGEQECSRSPKFCYLLSKLLRNNSYIYYKRLKPEAVALPSLGFIYCRENIEANFFASRFSLREKRYTSQSEVHCVKMRVQVLPPTTHCTKRYCDTPSRRLAGATTPGVV